MLVVKFVSFLLLVFESFILWCALPDFVVDCFGYNVAHFLHGDTHVSLFVCTSPNVFLSNAV